jgi:hypothetical protein
MTHSIVKIISARNSVHARDDVDPRDILRTHVPRNVS